MSYDYVKGGLTFALVGAGIGGTIGLLNVAKNKLMPDNASKTDHSHEYAAYPNILLDSVVIEALSRFGTYKNMIVPEFNTILSNLNKLIGLQVEINKGNIKSQYPFQATTYVTQIQTALNVAKTKVRNVSVPHWDVDETSIRQIADDYLYNISQDVNQFMLSSRTTH